MMFGDYHASDEQRKHLRDMISAFDRGDYNAAREHGRDMANAPGENGNSLTVDTRREAIRFWNTGR